MGVPGSLALAVVSLDLVALDLGVAAAFAGFFSGVTGSSEAASAEAPSSLSLSEPCWSALRFVPRTPPLRSLEKCWLLKGGMRE